MINTSRHYIVQYRSKQAEFWVTRESTSSLERAKQFAQQWKDFKPINDKHPDTKARILVLKLKADHPDLAAIITV